MLYNEKNEGILLDRKQYLRFTLDAIFDLGDETIAESVIGGLYNLCSEGTIAVDILEEGFRDRPQECLCME